MLKYNNREKSMNVLFVIYADIESLIEKIDTCNKNLEKSSSTKVNKYAACSYSLFTNCSYYSNKYKHSYCRGKDCMKNFYKDLKEHVMKITNFERQKMLSLIEKESKSCCKQKFCYMC